MSKHDLIRQIAERTDLTQTQAQHALDALIAVASDHLAEGRDVSLPGLGGLHLAHRQARTGRNPATGAAITVPDRTAIRFKAAKALKERLNP